MYYTACYDVLAVFSTSHHTAVRRARARAPVLRPRLALEPGLPQPGVAPPARPPGALDVDFRPRGALVVDLE
jgi:hypothetical protein